LSEGCVVALVRDLMDRLNIADTAQRLGIQVHFLADGDAPEESLRRHEPSLVIVDISTEPERWLGLVAAAKAGENPLRVLAFGRHTDREGRRLARGAGCDRVLANSRFFTEMAPLLRRWTRPG